MSATYVPSNFVTPSPKFGANPNWEVSESGKPEESTYVEYIHDSLMVCQGTPILAPQVQFLDPSKNPPASILIKDDPNNEVTANFTFKNVQIQQCTGLQLEQVMIHLPPPKQAPRSRNLTLTLCGDLIDDNWDAPRRFVWSDCDMTVPFYIKGNLHYFDITNFIPFGRTISYYAPSDIINYLVTSLNSYMNNVIGDATFTSYIYVDNIGPRFFFRSTTYGLNTIRLYLFSCYGVGMNALNLFLNHFTFTSPRTDTTQAVGTGESFGISLRSITDFQNNSPFMTLHSNELTQFRKSDSVAPVDGSSLIGVCSPVVKFESSRNESADGTYMYRVQKGTLATPKISFDKNKAVTAFDVSLRASPDNANFKNVQVTNGELANCSLSLIFRKW